MSFHCGLRESGSWSKFSFVMQMANIGSEVGRTIKWKNEGDEERSKAAFFRGLELIDLTVDDQKNRGGGKLKEVLRAKEMLLDHFVYDNIYKTTDEEWDKYFMDFLWLVAIERGRG